MDMADRERRVREIVPLDLSPAMLFACICQPLA